jgi:hypothetical protein
MRAFLITVVVLLVLGVAASFYSGWLRVSAETTSAGQSQVKITVDTAKIKEAAASVRDQVEKGGKDIEKPAPQPKTLTLAGTVRMVDKANAVVMIAVPEKPEASVKVDGGTKIRLGDREGTLADLKTGDPVVVTYHEERPSRYVAEAIMVQRAPR